MQVRQHCDSAAVSLEVFKYMCVFVEMVNRYCSGDVQQTAKFSKYNSLNSIYVIQSTSRSIAFTAFSKTHLLADLITEVFLDQRNAEQCKPLQSDVNINL